MPVSSITCAQSTEIPQAELEAAFSTQGSYMLSERGLCDLDTDECRSEHFSESCTAEDLDELGTKGIRLRFNELKRDKVASGRKVPKLIRFVEALKRAPRGTEAFQSQDEAAAAGKYL